MDEAIRKTNILREKDNLEFFCSTFLTESKSYEGQCLLANKIRLSKSDSNFAEKKEKVTDIHLTNTYTVYILCI